MSGSFIFREEWLEIMGPMTQEQRNNVINAIIMYAFDNSVPNLEPIEQVAFISIRGSIDRDAERYEKNTVKNRENGRKGGRPANKNKESVTDDSLGMSEKPVGYLGFSEKTQKNPTKPTEKVGFPSENPKTPILYPYPLSLSSILYPNPFFSFSFDSFSPGENESEQQKQKILEFFFFQRNWLTPVVELNRLIAYNNVGKRKWDKMDWTERKSAAELWKPNTEQSKRFSDDFLDLWSAIYCAAIQSGSPPAVTAQMLSDSVSVKSSAQKLILSAPEGVIQMIEGMINSSPEVKEKIKDYLNKKHLTKLTYLKCAT